MSWAPIKLSASRGCVLAASVAALAVALHWLIFPAVGPRIPFLFFLPSIILLTAFAGRRPGMAVAAVGFFNGLLLQPPTGSFFVEATSDRIALGAYAVMAVLLVVIGDYFRNSARRASLAEQRLRLAQEDAAVGLFEIDLKERTILGSSGLWRLLGRPVQVQPVPVTEWFRVLHPDDLKEGQQWLQQQLDPSARLEQEHRILLPDGRTRWLLSRLRVERDAEGEAHLIRGVAVDVTERKEGATLLAQTQEQLRQQVADLQELHELSAQLLTISDLKPQLQLILQTLLKFHGARLGLASIFNHESNTLEAAASVGFSDSALERLRRISAGDGACGAACREQQRVVIQDVEHDPRFASFRELAQRERFRSVHSTPLISHTGEILGVISVHLEASRAPTDREVRLADICARKAAVFVERAAAEALAKEGEQRFRTVIEASSIPFMILAPVRDAAGSIIDFRWTYLNAAAARAIGRSAEDLLGARIGEALPGTWDEPGLFECYVNVVERGEIAEYDVCSGANGIHGWFQVIASPLQGSVAIWFADVTMRKRQEQDLREADRRKDEFLATLAHELRNPLAPIRQAAMIAGAAAATDAQKRWSHAVIERQVQHMSLLLDDLLDVSRITRGNLQLRKQRTDLSSVLSAAVETVRPLLDAKHHQLLIDAPTEPVHLHADPLRLAQILSNLLTNAAKYTNPYGAIRVSAQAAGSELVIRVVDNGIGLAREDLSTIFSMFSQVKSAQERSEGGLGIGLALTKGLVELHGGVIEAASDGPGLGSTFSVRLPVIIAGEQQAGAAEARETRLVLSRRILIADDNRDAAESLAMLLRLEGHEVALAHDGESAWRVYQEFKPEAALLDIGMPLLSGYELAERIRAHPEGRVALLIAITGWGQGGDKARALAAGFDHHMTKPVEFERLCQLLRPASRRAGLAR